MHMNGEMKYGGKSLLLLTALVLMSAVSFSSCSKEGHEASQETPIRFTTACRDGGASVKGSVFLTDETMTDFGVFAAYTQDGPDAGKYDWSYMANVPYRRNSEDGTFDTSPERFWPVSGNLTFCAIAPYNRKIAENMAFDGPGESQMPRLLWTPDPLPRKQIDLCVAVCADQPKQAEIPLDFYHATSRIYFAANVVELEQHQFITIDSITLANIIGQKEVTITKEPPFVEWEGDGGLPRTSGYVLSRREGHLNDARLVQTRDLDSGVEITTEKGHLFLVPQSFTATSSDIELKVAYTLYYENAAIQGAVETVGHFNIETVMPECEWKPDTKYCFLLSIYDITREKGKVSVRMYEDSKAEYYAMVCSFLKPSDTKSVGSEYELSVQVGPEEVSPINKEVDWTVNGVSIQDIYDHPESSEVQALPVLLEYRDADGNALDPAGISGTGTQNVWVVCRNVTAEGSPALIKARTRWAATENTHKEATLELTVVGKGVSIDPYPTEEYHW